MECTACGAGDELLFTCERCDGELCADHHGAAAHECVEACAICGAADDLLYTCEWCRERLCDNHLARRHHGCEPAATCASCGAADDLLYFCERCRVPLCATHHGERYHDCDPTPPPDPALETEATETEATETPESFRRRDQGELVPVERPVAQVYPQTVSAGTSDGRGGQEEGGDGTGERDADELPPDAARPGYGPDRPAAEPVGPPESIGEWFRRQTYISLSVKVGLIAAFCNIFVFTMILFATVVLPG